MSNKANVGNGQESHERFYSHLSSGWRIQYDYRHTDGKLFSCIAKTIEQAREKRDKWLTKTPKG